MSIRYPILILLSLCSLSCWAQEENYFALDRVEVTGSRLEYRDFLYTPAVSLIRPGDYILQKISLANDSRNENQRKQELIDTVAQLLKKAGKEYQLFVGDTYRTRLTQENFKELLSFVPEEKRPDATTVALSVHRELDPNKDAQQQIDALRAMITQSANQGRTEKDFIEDTALGMNHPERYRYELIEEIASDSKKIRQMMGEHCSITVDGLNARIEWERVSAGELLLYVPYSMQIEDCSSQ